MYRGRTIEELIPRIERELGPDAIIVRRREGLTGGVLGFFQHPLVEIEAMPGTPGVDVYDERARGARRPTRTVPRRCAAPRSRRLRLSAAPGSRHRGACRATVPAAAGASARPPRAGARAQRWAPFAPPPAAGAVRPAAAQRVRTAHLPRSAAAAGAPAFAPPLHAHAAAPPAQSESAYVTAHLAALARRRAPARLRPRADGAKTGAAAARAGVERSDPRARRPISPERCNGSRHSAPAERRTVAPGSQARARAGVARRLQRYGIGDELAQGADRRGDAATCCRWRRGRASPPPCAATLAQRIPVAAAAPREGRVDRARGRGRRREDDVLRGAARRLPRRAARCPAATRR